MRKGWLLPTMSLVGLLACGGGAEPGAADGDAESAVEASSSVAQDAIERWTENAEGVAGYTVTLETDGQERTENYVKEVVDGLPVFVPEGSQGSRDAMTQFPQLLAAAREEGTGDVGGEPTAILVVDDVATLTRIFAMEGGPFQPSRMEIHVGRDDHLMRQITITGQATMPGGGEAREVTTTVMLEDWRTTDGFAYPFRTATRTEGLSDLVQGSTADVDAAAAEFERRLAEMPESQREAARQAMGNRFQAARQAASGDPLESVIVVKELQVRR